MVVHAGGGVQPTAKQRELERHELRERLKRRDAVRRDLGGDDQDGAVVGLRCAAHYWASTRS